MSDYPITISRETMLAIVRAGRAAEESQIDAVAPEVRKLLAKTPDDDDIKAYLSHLEKRKAELAELEEFVLNPSGKPCPIHSPTHPDE